MSAEGKGFLVACTILILIILGGIFTDWYGVQSDQRPAPAPIGEGRPTRPPHPHSIYYPPGEPQPKVPGWRKS
jgi:hypothetical protein